MADNNLKQAIVVRADIGMGKGKIAVQAAHASIEAFEKTKKKKPEWAEKWKKNGMAKIALKVSGKTELFKEYEKISDLPKCVIKDAGLTQLEQGTATCFAVGPAPAEKIDKYLRHLKLL